MLPTNYSFIYIYNGGKTGNKSDSMQMYKGEKKKKSPQRRILFVEILTNVKHSSF